MVEEEKKMEDLEKKIKICLLVSKPEFAGKVAEKAGQYERAFDLYMQAKEYGGAAWLIEKAPKLEIGFLEKAMELFLQQRQCLTDPKDYENGNRELLATLGAAYCAEKLKKYEMALEFFQQCARIPKTSYGPGSFLLKAAKVAEIMGLYEKAVELCTEYRKDQTPCGGVLPVEFIERAEPGLLKNGEYERLIALYLKIDYKHRAAQAAEKAGQFERAIRMMQQDRSFGSAMDVAKNAEELLLPKGQVERVVDLYILVREPLEAIRVAEKAGFPLDKVLEKYEQKEKKR